MHVPALLDDVDGSDQRGHAHGRRPAAEEEDTSSHRRRTWGREGGQREEKGRGSERGRS